MRAAGPRCPTTRCCARPQAPRAPRHLETELKLSNGWLHRFKERHALRVTPQAAAGEEVESAQTSTDNGDATQAASDAMDSGKPKRKPRATQRKVDAGVVMADAVDAVETNDVSDGSETGDDDEEDEDSVVEASVAIQEALEANSDISATTLEASVISEPASVPAVIRPLTYLSAVSVDPPRRWGLLGGN